MKLKKFLFGALALTLTTGSLYALPQAKTQVVAGQRLTEEKAQAIAEAFVPEGSELVVVTLDDEVYEFKFINFDLEQVYEITLEAKSGRPLEFEMESIKEQVGAGNAYVPNEAYTPALTVEKLMEMLNEEFADFTIEEIELDEDDNYWVYEVELENAYSEIQLTIHPETGEILKSEIEGDLSILVEQIGDRPVTLPSFPDEDRPVTLPSFPHENIEDKPVTLPSFPHTEEISPEEAQLTIHHMMPKGSTYIKTERENQDGQNYYEVIYTYKTMRIESRVDVNTGKVLEIIAKDTTRTSLKVENLYYKNPTYKPEVTKEAAESKALGLLKDSKVVSSVQLGEYKLLWAYHTVVANDEMGLKVILDTQTNAVRFVKAFPIHKEDTFISEEQVRDIINQQVAEGKILSLKLDKDSGVYHVVVVNPEHHLTFKIDARTGDILDYTKVPVEVENELLTEEEIREIIESKPQFKKVAITDIELDEEDDQPVYKVEGVDGKFEYEIEVDAKTGEILEVDKEKIEVEQPEEDEYLTKDEVIDMIKRQSQYKKINITQIELDEDDAIYEVEGVDGKFEYELEVDAKTGRIIDVEKDKLDDDYDEDDNDDEDDEDEDEDDDKGKGKGKK